MSSLPTARRAGAAKARTATFFAGVLAILSAAAIWNWLWNVTVVTYGPADKTYFDAKQAKAGQVVHLCFDDVTWHRICPSRLVQHVTCRQPDPANPSQMISTRLDLEQHVIDTPSSIGPIGRKCRRFVVPQECSPGSMTFSAFAQSECAPFGAWNPRYAYPPELKLEIVP